MVDFVGLEVELNWDYDGVPPHTIGIVIGQDPYCRLYEVKFPGHVPMWMREGWFHLT